jgi:hypothetical protein
MLTSAQEVYHQVVRALSPMERLRLANLILNELVAPDLSAIDQSDAWTEQDQIDLTHFAIQYATTVFPEPEETV